VEGIHVVSADVIFVKTIKRGKRRKGKCEIEKKGENKENHK
jgi:hypothetical protein